MNDKIKTALASQDDTQQETEKSTVQEQPEETHESKIVTTEEELEAYFIIKNILKPITGNPDDITYKDNERYMAILYKNKTTKWICRLYFNVSKKYITLPNEAKKEIRIDINNVYDIEKQSEEIINVVKRYINS
jgi:hypothetical protein